MSPGVRVSIVVPTHNRPGLLCECLKGISDCIQGHSVEVILVDDGSRPPLAKKSLPDNVVTTLLRLSGEGPAAARNAGASVAQGDVLLFTDDDTVPSSTWVMAALDYLDRFPDAVAVSGPIRSPKWDRLYEQSLEASEPHCWTANIAYRRRVFESIGGFRSDVFKHAHGEDRDLAIRASRHGNLGFAAEMEVRHTPRRIGVRDVARQAQWARDTLTLYALHPQLTEDFALPARLALVLGAGRTWLFAGVHAGSTRVARRAGRAAFLGAVATTSTAWTVVRTPPSRILRARHRIIAAQQQP